MSSKRKHQRIGQSKPRKRPRKEFIDDRPSNLSRTLQQPTLRCYYKRVSSLRDYLLSKLTSSASKARIRRLCDFAQCQAEAVVPPHAQDKKRTELTQYDDHDILCSLLNSTLVCHEITSSDIRDETLATDFAAFSQQSLSTSGSSLDEGTVLQSEVCEELGCSLSLLLLNPLLHVMFLCPNFRVSVDVSFISSPALLLLQEEAKLIWQ